MNASRITTYIRGSVGLARGLIVSPAGFFRAMPKTGGFMAPLLYVVATAVLGVGQRSIATEFGFIEAPFRLDLMLGSWVKQRIGTAAPIASQPICSASCVTIISSVMPSSAGRLTGLSLVSMPEFYRGSRRLSDYNDIFRLLIHLA